MIRLGFSVRVVGQPTLRAYDTRRLPSADLSINLVYLRDILVYLGRVGIRYYRIASTLLPDAPGMSAFAQLTACTAELEALATQVYAQGVRLTLHLDHHIALGSADDTQAARSLAIIEAQAALLERLDAGQPPDRPRQGVLVTHVRGPADTHTTLLRFTRRYRALSPRARSRLAVEHDTSGFSLGCLLKLHQQCGIPIVFDYLHWQMYNPEQLPLGLALGLALATWPPELRPEVHLSTARSEAHLLPARAGQIGRIVPPRPGQHADFIAASDLLHLLGAARGLPPFDIMLEAKAGDLALLRLRSEIIRMNTNLSALLD
jgi:UV DNA damage endonuclease